MCLVMSESLQYALTAYETLLLPLQAWTDDSQRNGTKFVTMQSKAATQSQGEGLPYLAK